jgi:hypothetical protein
MKSVERQFKHPLTSMIEDHLADLGLNPRNHAKQSEAEVIYRFSSSAGTTAVLRLYKHQDIGEPTKDWICFEFGVGLVKEADAARALKEICLAMHTCFIPLRVAAMPYDDGMEVLIMILRAEVGMIANSHVTAIINSSLAIADQSRERFGLPSVRP